MDRLQIEIVKLYATALNHLIENLNGKLRQNLKSLHEIFYITITYYLKKNDVLNFTLMKNLKKFRIKR